MMSDLVHTPSTKSEKNLRIAQTYAATLERRSRQTIVQIDLKVKYGKRWRMPQAQMDFFSMVFVEAKRFKNYLLRGTLYCINLPVVRVYLDGPGYPFRH